jgi:hypothetical protein
MYAAKRYAFAVLVLLAALIGCGTRGASLPDQTPPPPPAIPRTPTVLLLKSEQPTGRITLSYSALPVKARAEAKRVATSALSFYAQRIGAPWHDMRLSFVVGTTSANAAGEFSAPVENCSQPNPAVSINLQYTDPGDIQWTVPHELAHALFGCAVHSGRFGEGYAEALSQMYYRTHKGSGSIGLDPAEYRQANRPGIGVSKVNFQDFVALGPVRYVMLGSSLRLYESAHPGFLHRHYLAMYQQTRRLEQANGSIDLPNPPDELATGRLIDPVFGQWLKGQYILQDPPKRALVMTYIESRNQVRVVAIGYDYRQRPRKGLVLTTTVKQAPEIKVGCVTAASGLCPDVFDLNLDYVREFHPNLKQATFVVRDAKGRVLDTHTYPIL